MDPLKTGAGKGEGSGRYSFHYHQPGALASKYPDGRRISTKEERITGPHVIESMTEFFAYENLTWPEIATLPRNTPLVIPLGNGYPLESLESALGYPDRAGLLPPLPFGWSGSGLPVAEPLLAVYLANLVDSLQDDGFSQVYALMPQGLNWATWGGSAGRQIRRICLPQNKTSEISGNFRSLNSIPADEDRNKVVIVPIGHTEQHGYHLPMSTDTLIIDAIARNRCRCSRAGDSLASHALWGERTARPLPALSATGGDRSRTSGWA
jgi:hypothetical protein